MPDRPEHQPAVHGKGTAKIDAPMHTQDSHERILQMRPSGPQPSVPDLGIVGQESQTAKMRAHYPTPEELDRLKKELLSPEQGGAAGDTKPSDQSIRGLESIEDRERRRQEEKIANALEAQEKESAVLNTVESVFQAAQHGDKAAQQTLRSALYSLDREQLKNVAGQLERDLGVSRSSFEGGVQVNRLPNGDVTEITFVPPFGEHATPLRWGGAVSVEWNKHAIH